MMMKKRIAVFLALIYLAALPALAEDQRTVTVTGSATVLTDADSARVMLGVVSVAKEAAEASGVNARQIEGLISALKEAGVGEKDITTSYYYVNARRDYSEPDENGEYAIIGYEVSNSLSVTVRDISRVGTVIDLALSHGANSCDGIQFATTKAGEAEDDALRAAIGEARRRAALIAETCGGTLGEILSVTENYSSAGITVNNLRQFKAETEDSGAGTQILSEGLSFTATVVMTFALEGD